MTGTCIIRFSASYIYKANQTDIAKTFASEIANGINSEWNVKLVLRPANDVDGDSLGVWAVVPIEHSESRSVDAHPIQRTVRYVQEVDVTELQQRYASNIVTLSTLDDTLCTFHEYKYSEECRIERHVLPTIIRVEILFSFSFKSGSSARLYYIKLGLS